jgi:hypothetical protein
MSKAKIDKQTTAFKLFNYTFNVMVPTAFLFNEAYIKQFGTYTTMDKAYDLQIAEETRIVPRPLCIDEDNNPFMIISIVELLNKGVNVTFVNPNDSKIAYKIIMDQLDDIATFLKQQSYSAVVGESWENRQKRLLADSALLMHAANCIHPVAVRNTAEQTITNGLINFLNGFGGISTRPSPGIVTRSNKAAEVATHDAQTIFDKNLDSVTVKRLHQWRQD